MEQSGQSSHKPMSNWFQTPLGQHLLQVETGLLDRALSRRFGYHLLELGCANLNMFQASPIGHKFSFAPHTGEPGHSAYACSEAIPLGSETIDLVLLHHALEFSSNQHQLLREASRVLIAGGHMVIVSFNPISSWGLRNRLHRKKRTVPWNGRPLSSLRLTDWLKLLDFQVDQVQYGAYLLPCNYPGVIRYSSKLEGLASRLNWPTGAVYVITARKQKLPLTPIHPGWKKFPAAVGIPAGEKVSRTSLKQDQGESIH